VTRLDQPSRTATNSATAVGKALGLLDALGSGRDAEPLSTLASRSGLPKSTACRILKMMEEFGFVARKETLYCLGPRVLELGSQANVSGHHELRTASIPIIERLYDQVRTTVHLGVLVGAQVLVLEKITAPGGLRIPTRVGQAIPAACTAMGAAALAFGDWSIVGEAIRADITPMTRHSARTPNELLTKIDTTRRSGFAIDREEFRAGLTCVAAPVVVGGQVVATISASSSTEICYTAQRTRHVRDAAIRLGRALEERGQRIG